MENEKIAIELKNGKMVVLSVKEFDSELDVEDILKIDYHNILGEILTFPVIQNRIGNFRAEMEAIVASTKFDFEIFEAQLMEEKRNSLEAKSEKKVTISEVETAVRRDTRYVLKKKQLIEVQKNFGYLDALYWSANSKDTKLNRLSEKLRPEEFEHELLEDTINGVMIKMSNKAIK